MYLLPIPKELKQFGGTFTISYCCQIRIDTLCSDSVYHYAKLLQKECFHYLGFSITITKGAKESGGIFLCQDTSLEEESYQLNINDEGIVITGGNSNAILYAVQTLRQMIRQEGAVLSYLEIKDSPSIANRGFYMDVTRSRIPTLRYLKEWADKLSFYKINQLQLYMEHSFLFRDNSEVWRDDTPLTADDILELDAYCRKINIELVPSISCFGHLYKVLRTKSYSHLCELEGAEEEEFSFIDRMQHHTVDVSNEESFQYITKLIDEFIPLFSSKHFNICSDETFDLGKGNSKGLAEQIGIRELYIGFVKRLCEFVISRGKRPMFWGDIISGFPQAISQLPKEVICLTWGYAHNQEERETKLLHEAGATQYVCPGVAGWNQFINRIETSYLNISRMCSFAHNYQAIGVLNTDWGDYGHINHPEFSTAGMIFGASFSWNEQVPSFDQICKEISRLEYGDRTENFVSIIAKLAECNEFGWDKAVRFKEIRHVNEEDKKQLKNTNPHRLLKANEELLVYKEQLYKAIAELELDKRKVVNAYVIAAEGIEIFNYIGIVLCEWYQDNDDLDIANLVCMNHDQKLKLAVQLENWFYQYKEVWRTISRESELYQLQDVINWYADYLRE